MSSLSALVFEDGAEYNPMAEEKTGTFLSRWARPRQASRARTRQYNTSSDSQLFGLPALPSARGFAAFAKWRGEDPAVAICVGEECNAPLRLRRAGAEG